MIFLTKDPKRSYKNSEGRRGEGGARVSDFFFYKESKSKKNFFFRGGGGGGWRWGGARVSYCFTKNPNLKHFFCCCFLAGGGGVEG